MWFFFTLTKSTWWEQSPLSYNITAMISMFIAVGFCGLYAYKYFQGKNLNQEPVREVSDRKTGRQKVMINFRGNGVQTYNLPSAMLEHLLPTN